MKVKLKIKGKILLLILTASTLLYSISIGYILVRSRKIMIEDSIDNAKLVAENSAQKIQLFFERDLSLARTLAKGLSAFNKLDTTTWQQFFTSTYIPIVEIIRTYTHCGTAGNFIVIYQDTTKHTVGFV